MYIVFRLIPALNVRGSMIDPINGTVAVVHNPPLIHGIDNLTARMGRKQISLGANSRVAPFVCMYVWGRLGYTSWLT